MAEPRRNAFGQPIGPALANWRPPPAPPSEPLEGRYVRLEPLDPARHAADLFDAVSADCEGRNWTYRVEGPFKDRLSFDQWLVEIAGKRDPMFFAYLDRATGKALGNGAFMRIQPEAGSIEVGSIFFSSAMQRTRLATEAIHLHMKRAFDLGYRRFEWKCDALNFPSRRAAQRFGLSFEGVFRQATVYKGRNRDTVWYAAVDSDWSRLSQAFESWLAPSNFDAEGRQRRRLSDLTAPLLVARDQPALL